LCSFSRQGVSDLEQFGWFLLMQKFCCFPPHSSLDWKSGCCKFYAQLLTSIRYLSIGRYRQTPTSAITAFVIFLLSGWMYLWHSGFMKLNFASFVVMSLFANVLCKHRFVRAELLHGECLQPFW
jgi:hypothetical protein